MAEAQQQANAPAEIMLRNRAALAERLYVKGQDGSTVLAIPPELSKNYNVLAPSAALVQYDPMFTPGFQVIQLDPDVNAGDFYPLQGKMALAKNGLRKLSGPGGVEFDGFKSKGGFVGDPHRIEIAGQVLDVQVYTYHAVGYVRKSDGTKQELTGDHTWNPQQAVADIRNPGNGKKPDEASVMKQFLQAWKFVAPMSKSKAQNMILRDALGVKQKYDAAEARKPFFVVGYNLSVDHTDPNAMKIIAGLVGADMGALYGDAASAALPAAEPPVAPVGEDEEMPTTVDPETGEIIEDAGEAEILDIPGPLPDADDDDSWLTELRSLQEFKLVTQAGHPFNGMAFSDIFDHPNGGIAFFKQFIAWGAQQPTHHESVERQLEAAQKFVELIARNGGEMA